MPIDNAFQEMEAGDKLKRKTHRQFVTEWKEAMGEAVKLAQANISKAGEYNRKYYNKKAKAVQIDVGDHVLMKNVRESGGTGKLKSFWEEKIFKVVEKKENIPVYKIQGLGDERDTRVIHRNLMMKVDQLPLDVFDDGTTHPQPRKVKKTKTKKSTPRQEEGPGQVVNDREVTGEQHSAEDSDEELDGDLLVYEEILPEPVVMPELEDWDPREMVDRDQMVALEPEETGVDPVTPEEAETSEPEMDTLDPENAEQVEAEPEQEQQNEIPEEPLVDTENEIREPEHQPVSSEEELDSDGEMPLPRRSGRTRTRRQIYSYDENGQPIWEEI